MSFVSRLVCFFMTAHCLGSSGAAIAQDEWPQFRGPEGQGHTAVTGLPITWSETENVVWKTATPGEGHSSPVISGNQIWMTTAITKELTAEQEKERLAKLKNSDGLTVAGTLTLQAISINRQTGALEQTLDLFEVTEPEPKHSLNSYASPTPVIVGEKVFCHFGTYGIAAIDRNSGTVLWKNDKRKIDHQNVRTGQAVHPLSGRTRSSFILTEWIISS